MTEMASRLTSDDYWLGVPTDDENYYVMDTISILRKIMLNCSVQFFPLLLLLHFSYSWSYFNILINSL